MSRTNRIPGAQFLIGLTVLAVGVLLALDRMHVLHAQDFFRFWPLIVIGVGLYRLSHPRRGGRLVGVLLLVLGGWFQLNSLGWVHAWPGDFFWPAVLLMVGFMLVRSGLRIRGFDSSSGEPGSWIHTVAFWAGLKRTSQAADFRGGDLTAIMGGIELDLSGAKISSGPATLEVFCMWGGIELKVPKEWRLDIQLQPLLGGYADKTQQEPAPDAPVLVIKGSPLMAGVDIKN
jgi:LiaF transmembrane domain